MAQAKACAVRTSVGGGIAIMASIEATREINEQGPTVNLLGAVLVLSAGIWAILQAALASNAYEALSFGAIAFACGLTRLRISSDLASVPKVNASAPAVMAAIPFLGPSAGVPAMLGALGQLATTERSEYTTRQVLFQAMRYPVAALAGGTVYMMATGETATSLVPVSMPAFVAAIAAFGVVEMTAQFLLEPDSRNVGSAAALFGITATAGAMMGLWCQFCPRYVMTLTGAAVVAAYIVPFLLRRKTDAASAGVLQIVQPVASQVAGEVLSLTDPLTGLANDRYFYMFLQQEIGRSERKGTPLSTLLLDIDDFAAANDALGKAAADRALLDLGALIKGAVRDYDMVARCASDEFAVALPETGCDDACDTAERIRKSIAEREILGGLSIRVSVGVATYPEHGLTADDLMSSAHHALNRAKFSGKDRIVSCNEIVRKLKYGT
jgi:diguanylate cyclase (GGDEF)-like protein